MRSGRDRTVLGNTGPVLACIAIESYTIQFNNRHCIFKRLFLKETLHYVLGKQDCFVQYASSSQSKNFAERKKLNVHSCHCWVILQEFLSYIK